MGEASRLALYAKDDQDDARKRRDHQSNADPRAIHRLIEALGVATAGSNPMMDAPDAQAILQRPDDEQCTRDDQPNVHCPRGCPPVPLSMQRGAGDTGQPSPVLPEDGTPVTRLQPVNAGASGPLAQRWGAGARSRGPGRHPEQPSAASKRISHRAVRGSTPGDAARAHRGRAKPTRR
jgi:hypothetical protein